YAREILSYIHAARSKAQQGSLVLDFGPAEAAAERLGQAARNVRSDEDAPTGDLRALNAALRRAEADFINPAGLPTRPWYKHVIFAPGEYTGYAAVVIPGVNEAIDAHNRPLAARQLEILAQALDNAAQTLEAG